MTKENKMKLYTKTGDKGKTSLLGGRVDKDNIRVEVYGTVDELNAFIGKAITELDSSKFKDIVDDLEAIQHHLFDCGGDLANVMKERKYKLQTSTVLELEKRIDDLTEETPPLKKFILPGGTPASATLHIARTVVRRAERLAVTLNKETNDVPESIMQYLNRLSDYFFIAARAVNYRSNVNDIEYNNGGNVFR